jgi:hypothetical protein
MEEIAKSIAALHPAIRPRGHIGRFEWPDTRRATSTSGTRSATVLVKHAFQAIPAVASDGGQATCARLALPRGLAGWPVWASLRRGRATRIACDAWTRLGSSRLLPGTRTASFSDADGPGRSAQLNAPDVLRSTRMAIRMSRLQDRAGPGAQVGRSFPQTRRKRTGLGRSRFLAWVRVSVY